MHERMLLEDLLAYYNKLERPVANESDAVILKFGLTLQQIMDVVSKISLHSAPQSTQMLFAGREEPDHHDQPVAQLGE